MKCYECGEKINESNSLGAEVKRGKWKDVCESCYRDIVRTCQLCGDGDVMPSDVSDFILCKAELTVTCCPAKPPGIFRVIRYPFLSIPLIGSGSMNGNYVLFVDKLPKYDRHYEISGHICKKCAAPYADKFTAIYGENPKRYTAKGWNKELWAIEREHTRSTILANPDMLRDLECDQYDRDRRTGAAIKGAWRRGWDKIQEFYLLPDDLPTYHEWLLLDYKGVKVYMTSRDGIHGDGWLLLKPEPRYRRYAYGGSMEDESWVMFTASSLPTYKHCPDKPLPGQYYAPSPYEWDREQSLPAIRKAIRLGLLKQNGVFDFKGKPLCCR
jgi:hypothetical protein